MTGVIRRLGALALAGASLAWAADPAAYITEIKKGRGQVQVRTAGAAEWVTPQPLLALREGDQLRATVDAQLVVLYHAGGATRTVTAANSPFTIGPPSSAGPSDQVGVVAAGVAQFLIGKQGPQTFRRAASRSIDPEAVMLAPRETRLLPGPVTFEWEGPEQARYHVRVIDSRGVVWEQADVPRRPLPYPATAPALVPGVLYAWELETSNQSAQRARFEILEDAEARRVRGQLTVLDAARYSPGTLRVMRAAVLYRAGLYQEIRRELEPAAAGSDDPTVHLLLADVYQHVGLSARAARAYEKARVLSGAP
ncbi:MAG TPA: hypothetical protein VID04_14280 [Methylomirabilota bacterium]